MVKFELSKEQEDRLDAWFKHHWDVIHKGFSPRDIGGFCVEYVFGPTTCGLNAEVVCVWCSKDNPNRACNLTEDSDEGGFIFQYDENWNRLKASWEK